MRADSRKSTRKDVPRPYAFRWEPPDTMYIAYLGDIDGPAMAALGEETRVFTAGQPRVFIIVDVSKSGSVNADAREISAKNAEGLAMRGVAVVGASPTLRVLATLFTRGLELLRRTQDSPTRFFDSESDAREWIAERRRQLDVR